MVQSELLFRSYTDMLFKKILFYTTEKNEKLAFKASNLDTLLSLCKVLIGLFFFLFAVLPVCADQESIVTERKNIANLESEINAMGKGRARCEKLAAASELYRILSNDLQELGNVGDAKLAWDQHFEKMWQLLREDGRDIAGYPYEAMPVIKMKTRTDTNTRLDSDPEVRKNYETAKELLRLGNINAAMVSAMTCAYQTGSEDPRVLLLLSDIYTKQGNKLAAENSKSKATALLEKQAPANSSIQPQSPIDPKKVNKPIADKWALVIGISKFAYSKKHPEQPSIDLKYSAKDAQDFYTYLTTQAKFSKDHVLLLLNEAATRENIMAAFGDKFLPAVVRSGDQVVIYVATHGTPASKDPAKRNFIVAYDTNPNSLYATGVNMEELYKSVQTAVKSNRALIVMDTCYSGAGVPGARGVDDGANFDVAQISQGFGHLVLASSAPNERSWESKVSANGVFTKYLIQDLQLTKGNLKNTFEKLSNDVQWEVQNAFNQPQHPKLGGEWEGEDFNLSASPTEHRPILNPDLLNLMKQAASSPSTVPSVKEIKAK